MTAANQRVSDVVLRLLGSNQVTISQLYALVRTEIPLTMTSAVRTAVDELVSSGDVLAEMDPVHHERRYRTADKPRRNLGADCSCATFGGYDSLCVIHGPAARAGKLLESVRPDKPRADLVALLLQFEAGAGSLASMHLTGPDAPPAVAAWVEMRGHRVEPEQLTRRDLDGREIAWTMWTVTPISGPDWSVTCSLPDTEMTAPADQQVLARVQAALDGEPVPCPECDGPADHCADCGVPDGRPHASWCHQQPEAARSV